MFIAMLLAGAPVVSPPPVAIAFDAAATSGLPRGEASLTAHGETIKCRGVWLADMLAAAGHGITRGKLAAGVLAEAADGYRVLFSAGELDPGTGTINVLVADHCDGGSATASATPRLIVPGDRRAARSVRELQRLVYISDVAAMAVPH